MFCRYYALRKRVTGDSQFFFVTSAGRQITTRLYETVNKVLKELDARLPVRGSTPGPVLELDAKTMRKLMETAAVGHDEYIRTHVHGALHHSKQVAEQHYVLPTAAMATYRQQVLDTVDQSAQLAEYVKKK